MANPSHRLENDPLLVGAPDGAIPLRCVRCGIVNPPVVVQSVSDALLPEEKEEEVGIQWALMDKDGGLFWTMLDKDGEIVSTFRLLSGPAKGDKPYLIVGEGQAEKGGIVHEGDQPLCVDCFEKELESTGDTTSEE